MLFYCRLFLRTMAAVSFLVHLPVPKNRFFMFQDDGGRERRAEQFPAWGGSIGAFRQPVPCAVWTAFFFFPFNGKTSQSVKQPDFCRTVPQPWGAVQFFSRWWKKVRPRARFGQLRTMQQVGPFFLCLPIVKFARARGLVTLCLFCARQRGLIF